MITQVPEKKVFILSRENQALLEAVDKLRDQGRRINVLVSGDQGSGKSELANQYAATRGHPLATIEVGGLSDPRQCFGYMSLKDGATQWVSGLFSEALQTPNCVIHLQELNRPENDKALNTLFSVLDDTSRRIWIDELGDYLEVASGVTIFASMNEGYEFIGTQPLDPALANRFHIKIIMRYLPVAYERTLLMTRAGLQHDLATQLAEMAYQLRTNDQHPMKVSTRDLLAIADLIKVGVPRVLAMKSALGSSQDVLESILLQEHLLGKDTEIPTEDFVVMNGVHPTEASKLEVPPRATMSSQPSGTMVPEAPGHRNPQLLFCRAGEHCGTPHPATHQHIIAVPRP